MPYMVGSVNTNGYMTSLGNYITESGAFAQFSTDPSGDNISWFTEMPLRIPIAFNFSNVVFALTNRMFQNVLFLTFIIFNCLIKFSINRWQIAST